MLLSLIEHLKVEGGCDKDASPLRVESITFAFTSLAAVLSSSTIWFGLRVIVPVPVKTLLPQQKI